jgi:small subunit ribosomal protein S16
MLKIRLQRHGAKHAPFYRVVVAESTAPRDGRFIEILGTYNPQAHVRTEELDLRMERIDHWLGVGAQPTDTARSLIRQGRLSPEDWLKRAEKLAQKKTERMQSKKSSDAPSMDENAGQDSSDAAKAEAEPEQDSETKAEDVAKEESRTEEEAASPESEESASDESSTEDEETSDDATDAKDSSEEKPAEELGEESEAKSEEAAEEDASSADDNAEETKDEDQPKEEGKD